MDRRTFLVSSGATNVILALGSVFGRMDRQKASDILRQALTDSSTYDKVRANCVNICDRGAIGNGTDQYRVIADALGELDAKNGGELVIPFDAYGGVFGVSETILIPENVVVNFVGGSVKVLGTTTYDAAFSAVAGATNIEVRNPQIDGNAIPGACGIILRRNNSEFRVIGGLIRNCAHDQTRKGGRAINIEAGVDPSAYGPRNAVVLGTIAKDCYDALSVSGGGSTQQESNIRVDMLAENCQSAISLFGNTAGYPHDVSEMGAHITMTARNCGKAKSYARAHGVINSDRGCNARIDLQVMNDSMYGPVGSLWRGDAYNVDFVGQMTGECSEGLLNFSSFQEKEFIDADATWTSSGNKLSSLDSKFVVKHTGEISEVITLPIVSSGFLTNCQFDLNTDYVASGKPGNNNTANKTTCWMRIQSKLHNTIIEGYLADIGSDLTFASYSNRAWRAH